MTDPRKLPPAGHPTKPIAGAKTPPAPASATPEAGRTQPTQRLRAPLPTLLELGQESATQTLRPPGAVPPAPRGIPGATPFNLKMEDVFEAPVPEFPREPGVPAEAAAVRAASEAAKDAPEANLRAPAPPRIPAEPPPVVPSLVTPRTPAQARPLPPASAAPVRSRANVPAAPSTLAQIAEVFRRPKTLGLLALAGATGGILALTWPREDEGTAPGASASAGLIEPATPRAVAACLSRGVHQKLAQSVDLSVPVIALSGTSDKTTATGDSPRLALGFAAGSTEAVGLTIDPLTLDAAQAFSEKGAAKLSSVVPLPGGKGKPPAFVTSRIDGDLLSGTALQLGSGLTRIVTTKRGLEAGAGAATTSVLWPELAGTDTTPPRAEMLGDGSGALVLRRGGRSGEIVVGLLGRDGRAAGQMTKITTDAHEFGTPSVAASDREILVSFATRKTQTAPWRIELARAPLGQRPAASRSFVPSDLPEQNNMISPTASALPGGGWLLQWTEGGAENKYRVRLQTLDATLAPVGAPITVGPDGANAGQGAAWAGIGIDTVSGVRTATKRAVSFYVVRTGQGSELWATALECR